MLGLGLGLGLGLKLGLGLGFGLVLGLRFSSGFDPVYIGYPLVKELLKILG